MKRAQTKLTLSTAVPNTPEKRTTHDYVYDIFAECAKVLREAQTGEDVVE